MQPSSHPPGSWVTLSSQNHSPAGSCAPVRAGGITPRLGLELGLCPHCPCSPPVLAQRLELPGVLWSPAQWVCGFFTPPQKQFSFGVPEQLSGPSVTELSSALTPVFILEGFFSPNFNDFRRRHSPQEDSPAPHTLLSAETLPCCCHHPLPGHFGCFTSLDIWKFWIFHLPGYLEILVISAPCSLQRGSGTEIPG